MPGGLQAPFCETLITTAFRTASAAARAPFLLRWLVGCCAAEGCFESRVRYRNADPPRVRYRNVFERKTFLYRTLNRSAFLYRTLDSGGAPVVSRRNKKKEELSRQPPQHLPAENEVTVFAGTAVAFCITVKTI